MRKCNWIVLACAAMAASLSGRGVGAAVITHNLTAPGSGAVIDGAIFQQSAGQPAGSGFIDSFLRVQMKGYEEGFNTDARPVLCDSVDCDVKTVILTHRRIVLRRLNVVTVMYIFGRENVATPELAVWYAWQVSQRMI